MHDRWSTQRYIRTFNLHKKKYFQIHDSCREWTVLYTKYIWLFLQHFYKLTLYLFLSLSILTECDFRCVSKQRCNIDEKMPTLLKMNRLWRKRKATAPPVLITLCSVNFQRDFFCTHFFQWHNNCKTCLVCFNLSSSTSTWVYWRVSDSFLFPRTGLHTRAARWRTGANPFQRGRPHWHWSTEVHVRGIICLPLLRLFSSGQALIKLTQRIISFLPNSTAINKLLFKTFSLGLCGG